MEREHRPPVDPRVAAVFDEMKPYAITAAGVAMLGAPADALLPVVRRLRGRSGVATGPGLVTLAHSLVALAVVHVVRRDPARVARLKDTRPPRWLPAVPLYLLLAPAAASGRGIVLRDRSALWGALLHPAGLLQVVLLGVTLRRARRAKRTGS